MIEELLEATLETVYMTGLSFIIAFILGLPLGIILHITSKSSISPHPVLYKILSIVVNILRSIPFLIIFAIIYPLMASTMGKYSVGWTAMIPPLVISATPFIARLVETSLQDVNVGIVEASISLGASKWQVIKKVYLSEARPTLISSALIAIVTIVGYTAMSGIVAGGGLGDLALNYAFRHVTTDKNVQTIMTWASSLIIIVIVNIIQEVGLYAVKKIDKRKI